jgi:predicted NBD/HSP70 family sugar kinase
VREEGEGVSSGGRKPILLSLDPKGAYVAGVHIGVRMLRLTITDLLCRPLARRAQAKADDMSPEELVSAVTEGIRSLAAEAGIRTSQLRGVGVATPGPCDPVERVVLLCPELPGWRQVPLGRMLEEALGQPAITEKDANAAALGEHWYGAGTGVETILFVYAGEGIGSGLVLRGELYRGNRYGAGEIGHMSVASDGIPCHCGSIGCVERYASGTALRLEAQQRWGRPVSLTEVLDAAKMGDTTARQMLDRAARYMGIGLVNAVNLYSPELVLVGGPIPTAYPRYLDLAAGIVAANAYPTIRQVRVAPAALDPDAVLQGAAALALQNLFRPLSVQAVWG